MPDYCDFDAYLVGSKEDIQKFDQVMKADYSYKLNSDFLRNIEIYKIRGQITNPQNLDETIITARLKARRTRNYKALEMLKDENLKKEHFKYIPEAHFCKVLDYHSDGNPEHLKDNIFISRSYGTCVQSLEHCIIDLKGEGYYSEGKAEYPSHIFTGTNLIEFAKKAPDLKMALVSKNPDMGFSEFFIIINGKIIENQCERFEESFYISIEETAENGQIITEDQVDEKFYNIYPKWFKGNENEIYIDEDYVFSHLEIPFNPIEGRLDFSHDISTEDVQ